MVSDHPSQGKYLVLNRRNSHNEWELARVDMTSGDTIAVAIEAPPVSPVALEKVLVSVSVEGTCRVFDYSLKELAHSNLDVNGVVQSLQRVGPLKVAVMTIEFHPNSEVSYHILITNVAENTPTVLTRFDSPFSGRMLYAFGKLVVVSSEGKVFTVNVEYDHGRGKGAGE